MNYEKMRADDAAMVAQLATQLGYPCTAEEVRPRIEAISALADEQLRVARHDGRAIGYIHFLLRRGISGAPRVEIAQVVVEEAMRGRGIGRTLLLLAEDWARERGVRKMKLASRATRPDAHRLYLKLGYTIVKTSHFFEKPL
ncbi:MAG TPA: GNAT family N-acetyltransferase [Myxococcales bacterium]|jgi:GNAT superfamily N-acetyltransferase